MSAITALPIEHRTVVMEPPEFRGKGTTLVAAGVAMRYGAKSKPIAGQFREVFLPGAFTKTLQEQDVHSHNEHHGPYLGRTGAGTLRLTDTRSELAYEIDLPDTGAGRDAAALLERGDIKGSSIGFRALPKQVTWSVEDDGMALRSISAAVLSRVDLTIEPYYPDSTAGILRSLADETGLDVRSLVEASERGTTLARMLEPVTPGPASEAGLARVVQQGWYLPPGLRGQVGGARQEGTPARRAAGRRSRIYW